MQISSNIAKTANNGNRSAMVTVTLDSRDHKLLTLLTNDARCPVAELARQLDLSRTAVRHRIEKLERHGVIRGYTLKGENIESQGVQALATVTLSTGTVNDLKKEIQHLSGVKKIWSLAGNIDAFVLIQAETVEDLYKVINVIGNCTTVKRMSSHIVLEQMMD